MADKLLNKINDPENQQQAEQPVAVKVEVEEELPKVEATKEVKANVEMDIEEEEEPPPKQTKRDLFDIPEDVPPKKETPKQKKKRVMSEAQ